MKVNRSIRMALLLLTAGAVVNVMVAWIGLLIGRSINPEPVSPLITPPSWPEWASLSWPAPQQQNRMNEWWIRVDTVRPFISETGSFTVAATREAALGWPMRSLGWTSTDMFVPGEEIARRTV